MPYYEEDIREFFDNGIVEPRHPDNAYVSFTRDYRKILCEDQNISIKDYLKLYAKKWNSMTLEEHAPYYEKEEKDMELYKIEMTKYKTDIAKYLTKLKKVKYQKG